MSKFILTSIIFLAHFGLSAQKLAETDFTQNGEVVLGSLKSEIADKEIFSKFVSLDHKHHHDSVFYYVMRPEMEKFNALEIPFTFQRHPNEGFAPEMVDVDQWNLLKSTDCGVNLTAYPTYGLYEQMMTDFANDFPDICRLVELGTLSSGRKILAVKISDNPDSIEAEPRFLYTSTMHGDETAGYILTLRLIREILCGYETDAGIQNLVNNVEIWINPLANPNGTYHGGNNTVSNARRGNSANIDLNRNFPDPLYGPNPFGVPHQQETVIFMDFAEDVRMDLSSNMHGGIELINYPWDTYPQDHADSDWWIHICREYADTAQANAASGYFDALNDGITNGYAWYPVAGGRQDFVTYFKRGRETTLELTNTKLMPVSQFESRWQYNRNSFYNYMEQSLYGLRGLVTDALTGNSVVAEVHIAAHDIDNSSIFSRLPHGNYHRYLKGDSYQISFSAPGYISQTHTVEITDNQTTFLDVQLVPEGSCAVVGGMLTTISPLTGICIGDGNPKLVEVSVGGNVGLSRFGLVQLNNDVVATNTTGIFNMENYPGGSYRIAHMSYDQTVNLVGITNANQLSGCYNLSNFIQINTSEVDGGSISALDDTFICGGIGNVAQIEFQQTGAYGPNQKWVVLYNDLSDWIIAQDSPLIVFDQFEPGNYKVVHASFGNGVNFQNIDPQNPVGCINASNPITVTVSNCGGIGGDEISPSGIITNDSYQSLEMELYPNPANEMVRVNVSKQVTGFFMLSIYDLQGRLMDHVMEKQVTETEAISFTYQTDKILPGVYLIGATQGRETTFRKILIYH